MTLECHQWLASLLCAYSRDQFLQDTEHSSIIRRFGCYATNHEGLSGKYISRIQFRATVDLDIIFENFATLALLACIVI